MRIAICEDNREHAEILQNMILRWAKKENRKVELGYYQSAEQFLCSVRSDVSYDAAFLDIQMGKISGLQLAKLIREEDKTMVLIFTTGIKGLAPKGYEVEALRYLVKPLKEHEVVAALSKTVQILEQTKKDAVIISCNGEVRRIYKNSIYYIEGDDHYINLYLKDEVLRFKARLKDFDLQFEKPQFCKCHRSYIVNLHYVDTIKKDCIEVENGKILPLSKARWDEVNKCYLAYYL